MEEARKYLHGKLTKRKLWRKNLSEKVLTVTETYAFFGGTGR
jgi:hypothetical protein